MVNAGAVSDMPQTAEPSVELRQLLDAAVDGIVIISHAGHIVAFNRAAERLFGYRSRELLGRNVGVLMSAAERAAHDAHLTEYLATGTAHILGKGREVSARRKDGSSFPAFLSVGTLQESEPPRFVGFLQDLTLRQHAQQQARRLQERLFHVSRLATMEEMASGIAHQLNQPLTAIANYAQACERLLAKPAADYAEIRGALREITLQALHAGDCIRRLRVLTRHQDGEPQATDINELITDLTDLVQPNARSHDVHYRLELADDLPPAQVHRAQIQRVILNLVQNAIEALADTVGRPRDVLVRTARTADGDVEVGVCDSGPGVQAALAPSLFEPFHTSKPQGTGLGLAISRTIVRDHHGTLEYRANVPAGACFLLRLPRGFRDRK
ncbi:MAG TPA: PAS domain S-box protein [Steroidobacteraceae bacterium]|jgi:two-component system sensor kinase FixL